MGKLDGKVALVTGGSRGIGKGIARGLAAEGADLVLASRDQEALENTARELGGSGNKVIGVPTDVSDEIQVEALFSEAIEQFGRLDILVNNAGAFDGGPIEDLSADAWDHVMAVNLRAPFLCTRAAFRIMKPQGGGRIINIGSISAQRVRMNSSPYSTSKFGIWGLTQSTALEGRAHGIACSCLHPGNTLVERRVDSGSDSDEEPMMSVDELAEAAVLMATLPAHVNMLEAIVLPVEQQYLGRG
jgi:NAD(P)-dependent dehydrogenase (short-subunit alcohol dehydrogenase family)